MRTCAIQCISEQIRGNEVQNPFVISEVFTKTEDGWKLVAETYTRIATDFDIYRM